MTSTVEDLEEVGELALAAWTAAIDRDWSVPAGTLEWSCLATADHTIDCVFSYALFLASRKADGWPGSVGGRAASGDPWTDLLVRRGRPAPT